MEAMRIRKHLSSDTLELSGLKDLVGKDVEIIILEEGGDRSGLPRENGKRKPGLARGMVSITDDFHLPLGYEMVKEFYK